MFAVNWCQLPTISISILEYGYVAKWVHFSVHFLHYLSNQSWMRDEKKSNKRIHLIHENFSFRFPAAAETVICQADLFIRKSLPCILSLSFGNLVSSSSAAAAVVNLINETWSYFTTQQEHWLPFDWGVDRAASLTLIIGWFVTNTVAQLES